MNIALRFINRSNDCGSSEVALFQRNVIPEFDELAIAWRVIRYCGRDCIHPFTYSTDIEIALGDDHGNFSPRISAAAGSRIVVASHPGGRPRLASASDGALHSDIEVVNQLGRGAVNVNAYVAGRLMAAKTAVAPGQKAVFQFAPVLWIGVGSQIEESRALASAVVSSANAPLDLHGIASADIAMTGGGSGESAQPFRFELENVVRL
ncbi:hypothetical protein [Trinickia soli]|jgi:hypothetical protein|uniref:Aromatic ring-opening dioxygenase LigA n=1 Tax=Trinickia soli TaxID=380675 RepID=A0A2N7VET4_9BURK|nr:hypothetical protein [Trinickia soli]KAA0087918.1 hypothetical protein CIW54_13040 [Paraburkholderia sp. T12-10]PMS15655.1 hypothetical protein C0Z19_27230 [Trinickia soli]CAB3728207.1 hypothetical protein LMG24076_05234 [Trinickia soli]